MTQFYVCLSFLGQTIKSKWMTTMKVLHTLCPSDSILKDPFCVCWGPGGGGGSTNGVQWDLTFIDLRISRMYVLGVQWNLLAIVEPAFIQHDIVPFWNAMNVLHLESLTLGKDVIPKMTKGMNWGGWPIECKDLIECHFKWGRNVPMMSRKKLSIMLALGCVKLVKEQKVKTFIWQGHIFGSSSLRLDPFKSLHYGTFQMMPHKCHVWNPITNDCAT
jgi:hypothetical protein